MVVAEGSIHLAAAAAVAAAADQEVPVDTTLVFHQELGHMEAVVEP